MQFIKYTDRLGKEDVKEAGGKGANLAELTNAGFPVPECFFITVNAYFRFLDGNGLRKKISEAINGTDFSNFDSMKDASEKIKAMVAGAKMPSSARDEIKKAYEGLGNDAGIRPVDFLHIDEKPLVAVRSSAVTEDVKGASSAGQQETFLNVKGTETLMVAVQKCWASLFTERAIYYRHKHNLPQDAGISVIVQRMVNSEKCVHPNTFIQTEDGEVVRIQDLVENTTHQKLISLDLKNNLKLESSKCLKYNMIEAPEYMYELRTRTNSIITTDEHKFFVLDGLETTAKPLKELKEKDRIASARRIDITGKKYKIPDSIKKEIIQKTHKKHIVNVPDFLTNELSQILGYISGDGYIRGDSSIIITDKDEKNLFVYKKLIKNVLGLDGTIKPDGGRKRLLINNYGLVRLIKKLCPEIVYRSRKRKIPSFIQKLPKEEVSCFLKGLFDAEGCINKDIVIVMSSEYIIETVRFLLLRFGIIAHKYIYIDRSGFSKGGTFYRLQISEQESKIKFLKHIGLSSPDKKTKLMALVRDTKKRQNYTNTDIIPLDKKTLREVIAVLGIKKKSRIFQSYLYRSGISRKTAFKIFNLLEIRLRDIKNSEENSVSALRATLKIPRKIIAEQLGCSEKLIEKIEKNKIKDSRIKKEDILIILRKEKSNIINNAGYFVEKLSKILNSDIIWDEILTIRKMPCNEKWFYDLTINPHSNYLANGFITHNSGVMFTINPVTSENNITVEAVWGLGETIVQGEVTPDTYVVDKSSGAILEKKIGSKLIERIRDSIGKTIKRNVNREMVDAQVLTDAEIVKTAAYGKKIERHYGFPQDIEFAVERGKIYIVQSRAVTFFAENMDEDKSSGAPESAGRERAAGEASQKAPPQQTSQILLRGMGVSPGIGFGIVKIILNPAEIDKIQKGDVLVTEMTNPDFVPAMEKAAAIVTNRGGVTSHAAIVSRELGVPAVVGTVNATEVLKDGQTVTVDATNGIVYEGILAISANGKTDNNENNLAGNPAGVSTMEVQSLSTASGESLITATQVKVNLAFPHRLEELAKKSDGVGLMRLEHVLTEAGMHPFEYIRQGKSEELARLLAEKIGAIAKAFFPKPVWVRTLDVRTDEFRNMKGGENEKKEDNPMLGWHGIRRDLDEPEMLKAQFAAFMKLHEDGLTNVKVMLPFVISAGELRSAKRIAKDFGLPDTVKFGIMCETPACALTMEDFCREGIDFVSFGSNDLTQTTLAVDRNNESLAKIFNSFHPAVLRLFREVIRTCRKYGVESSICGEEGSDPKMAEILVGYGIDSLSANIDAVDKIRQTVAIAERKLILDKVRKAEEK
ncbi:MAG: phosphoenolpyruvate synthase [Nanoarchaeota archaeon]|nr:phosphoenolpyruvate synthase [Nanoarchaeota archaeon]